MSLSSFFRKNKQQGNADDADTASIQLSADADSQTVRARKRRSTVQAGADGTRSMPVDPVLPEKKRARRRLVGAVALVLAAIIILPMVLDSEPKPLPSDLTIEIPAKDAALNKPRTPTLRAVEPASALDQKEEVVEMLAARPADARPVDAEAAAGGGAGAATEADGRQTKFMVQVGAFASQEKVNEMRGRLKAAGIVSHTQKISTDGGDRVRIRVGPFNSRPDADKMRVKLSGMGVTATISPLSTQ